ncbi:MAG: hypothetical protein ACRD3W_06515, partial [Terriglobales bacterium]
GLYNKHGIGIPGVPHRFDDEEYTIPAKGALIALTGRAPKEHETNDRYLRAVQVDATRSVSGTVVSEGKGNTKKSPKDKDSMQISVHGQPSTH